MRIRQEINRFFLALGFFTRIPMPKWIAFSQTDLNHSSRYFVLVGWIIGLLLAGVFLIASTVFDQPIAVLLTLGFGFVLTGCFHEDGLADTADGFGGGWTKEQKLSIMKDSRLGTYGSIALWFSLSLKWALLSKLSSPEIALILIHPLSRLVSTLFIFILPYVRDPTGGKPLAEQQKFSDLSISFLTCFPIIFLMNNVFIILTGLFITILVLRSLFKRQIGGFTGDALGASQQISELVILLGLVVMEQHV